MQIKEKKKYMFFKISTERALEKNQHSSIHEKTKEWYYLCDFCICQCLCNLKLVFSLSMLSFLMCECNFGCVCVGSKTHIPRQPFAESFLTCPWSLFLGGPLFQRGFSPSPHSLHTHPFFCSLQSWETH